MKLFLKILGILIAILLLGFFIIKFFVINNIDNMNNLNNEAIYKVIKNHNNFKYVKKNKNYSINLSNNDTLYYFHFWATYCKPCIEEFDEINTNYDNIFKGKIKLIVISFEDIDKQRVFLEKRNYKMTFYKADSSSFFIKPNVEFLPTTILVKDNKVIDKVIGTVTWSDINY